MRLSLIAAAVGMAVAVSACSDTNDDYPDVDESQAEQAQDTEHRHSDDDRADTATFGAENPFFMASSLQYEAPDFAAIEDSHYAPAFDAGMEQQAAEIQAIIENPEDPSFANTIEAMERSGELLTRVSRVFFAMAGSTSNDTIRDLQGELAPKLSSHRDDIFLNSALFERVDSLYEQRDELDLESEQLRLLEVTHERFIRAGANLSEEQMAQIRELNEEESELTTRFARNVLEMGDEIAVVVDSEEELEGLDSSAIRNASRRAEERDMDDKYVLSITNTTRQPVLSQLSNREVRQRVWEASAYRGLGRDGGIDNTPIVSRLAKLRAERAEILGYDTFADYALEERMIGTPQNALDMLTDMVDAVVANTLIEQEILEQQAADMGHDHDFEPWDWEFYAERVRESQYDLDENEVREYFEFDRVLHDGVFYAMERLYGITFEKRDDLPAYHEDVSVYEVFDNDGASLGIFYADYFAREGKRGGAWMGSFVNQSHMIESKPVIYNVMNIPKGPDGEPTLVSYDHVTTMFHEMGHGVHGLFSDVYYPSLAGTSVPRDFVESPSTFHEDLAHDPEILANYAKHYETGEQIPEDLLSRVMDALSFNQGFNTLEYMSAALLDLEWHMLSADEPEQDVENFEAEALAKYGVNLPNVPPRYKSAYFSHIFSGGYAAGYYSYMWSEVLAADAFAYFMDEGGLEGDVAQQYREHILSRGGTKEAMEMYIDFRGSEPDTQHLLIRRGLSDGPVEPTN
ncbi:dipeptidyl carboxypeptidase II [Aliidiomarina minuta]|uniref:Dipeptidyl carboxypeptidase II n=1 Tax=Aliidiomarina minuta TaxID=880057 RepID=A0A432WBG5_9GAMM|nr:M3 family metallopeptidase [Aliidiomarina minuta]RUO26928.1 dipeptidyl carboxypeptidase II [Aliidiomarina minuta]